jgi:tetratricopeptide (TPR) repeat protein
MIRVIQLICLCLFLGSLSPGALAARQIALVVGNNFYENLPDFRQLKKAANDARAIAETLKSRLGFDVRLLIDGRYSDLNAAIKQVENDIEPGSVVFFYFSGHGVAVDGANYLLPSDVPQPIVGEEQRLAGSSFPAEQIISRFQKRGAKAVFAVLDACRDNPFETESGKSAGGGGGLSQMEAAEGVFILFAAGVGQTALDRLSETDSNPNSVFTRNLLPLLETDGLSQIDLAKKLYSRVKQDAASVGHIQHPAYYDQIDGYISLGKSDGQSSPQVAPVEQDLALATPTKKDFPLTKLPQDAAQRQLEKIYQSQTSGDIQTRVTAGETAQSLAAGSFGEDSMQFADASAFLMKALDAAGDTEGAIRAQRRILPIYEENFGGDSRELASARSGLATRLVAVKKLREADKLFDEALKAYDKKSPGNNVYIGMKKDDFIILANIYKGQAELRREQGKLKEALRVSDKALNIISAADDDSLADHGAILAGHAHILSVAGNCADARKFFESATKAFKKARVAVSDPAYADALAQVQKQC